MNTPFGLLSNACSSISPPGMCTTAGWTLADASILAWSSAALPTRLPEVVHEVTRQLDAQPALLQAAQSIDVSNLLWAIAQIDVHASPFLLQTFTVRSLLT